MNGTAYAVLCLPEAVRLSGEYKRLADACGVHWRTVYKWGAGEAAIPADREEQLAGALVECGPGPSVSDVLHSTASFMDQMAKTMADGLITVTEARDVRGVVQRCLFALESAARAVERRAER